MSNTTTPGGARHVALALDGNDLPVLAYEDVASHQVIVRVWDGTQWVASTASRAFASAWWPRLAYDPTSGAMILAWQEDNARIQVCRLR